MPKITSKNPKIITSEKTPLLVQSSEYSGEQQTGILHLYKDIFNKVAEYLNMKDLGQLRLVCRKTKKIVDNVNIQFTNNKGEIKNDSYSSILKINLERMKRLPLQEKAKKDAEYSHNRFYTSPIGKGIAVGLLGGTVSAAGTAGIVYATPGGVANAVAMVVSPIVVGTVGGALTFLAYCVKTDKIVAKYDKHLANINQEVEENTISSLIPTSAPVPRFMQ